MGEMIRFECATLDLDSGSKPTTASDVRIIMPLSGFVEMFARMQNLIDRLIKVGLLVKDNAAPTGVRFADHYIAVAVSSDEPDVKLFSGVPAEVKQEIVDSIMLAVGASPAGAFFPLADMGL